MRVDSKALKVLTDWNSQNYKSEEQKLASLQVLIISALREQDKLTRHACATATAEIPEDMSISDFKDIAYRKCINARVSC